ncbi:hypothetical protein ACRYCC_15185 [Actinomadura scrupuli]|uniref:hypothetical protein n=1 Tax=Actinomadura scrupuli TaxID=559629 RepID=UPI003D97D8BE
MSGVLVVPVHLDALCLTNDLEVVEPTADFSRLPYRDPVTGRDRNPDLPYVSEIVLPAPFQDRDFRLKPGIHLHWALPDALTRLVQADDGSTLVPTVPNRWLVTRSNADQVEAEWIVESDFLSDDNVAAIVYPVEGPRGPYRRLGRRVPLSVWKPATDRSGYLPALTAVGYGEPTFAAFYPNCHSVFGLHDPGYPGNPPRGLRYEVVGWYDDPRQDAVAGLGDDPAWREAYRTRLGWTVSPDDTMDGGLGGAAPYRMACYAQLTFTVDTKSIAGTGGRAVRNPLLVGPDAETGVCVGNTATEALAAHLGTVLPEMPETPGMPAVQADAVEDLLEALAFADELETKPLDLGAALLEARHTNTFHEVPSGTLWTLRRQDESGDVTAEQRQSRERLTVPHELSDRLNLLNRAQTDLDRARQGVTALREQLFADWYKYQLCAYPSDSRLDSYPDQDEVRFFLERKIDYLGEEIARSGEQELAGARAGVDTSLAALNVTAATARARYVLQEVPAPPYQLPNEPVVLLTGTAATPSDRYGQDGALHPSGLLECAVTAADHPDLSTAEQVRALRAEAAAAIGALRAPGFAIGTWQHPPWHPVLLQWEVEFFPTTSGNNLDPGDRHYHDDFITRNYVLPDRAVELQPVRNVPYKAANVYTGTSILSPGARPVLSARVLRYLQGTVLPLYNLAVQPTVSGDDFLADPTAVLDWFTAHGQDQRLTLLIQIYRHLVVHEDSNLSCVLGGFNEALLMRKLTRQLPVADPLGFPSYQEFAARVAAAVDGQSRHAPQPLSDFNPIRAGALRLLRLRIVDSFGSTLDVNVDRIHTTTQLRVPGHPDWVAMPPRLAQPARLSFTWLDAEHDVQQMNGLPDTSPICGWLVPNNLDDSLAVYAADGSAVGALYALADLDGPGTAQWREPPGAPATPVEAIANRHLRAVVQRLRDDGPTALGTLLGDLDDALQAIEPEDYAQHRGRAVLMGRPIAVVRAELTLELMGWPAVHQDWNVFRQDMRRASRETNRFPLVRFPIRIGEHEQLNDAVLGFWVEDSAQRLGPTFHSVQGARDPIMQAIDLPPQFLTMLVDPRGEVHATSGVLPCRSLRIPAELFRDALRGMAVGFFTAPVLTDADHVALPLPNEPGFTWSWQEATRTGWLEQAEPPQPDARIPVRPTLREGWSTLRPAPEQGNG